MVKIILIRKIKKEIKKKGEYKSDKKDEKYIS